MKYIITAVFLSIVGVLIATKNYQYPDVEVRAINVSRVVYNSVNDSGSLKFDCWGQTRTVDKELPIGESIHTYVEEKCIPRGGE